MRERAARTVHRHGALMFGIGCIALGIVVDQWIRMGWAPLALACAVLLAKTVLGIIAKTFFEDEYKAAMDWFNVESDPVKRVIWHHHHHERHEPKFRECLHPTCAPYK